MGIFTEALEEHVCPKKATLFLKGNFKLHSGGQSDLKIDCDALTDEDIETMAYIIATHLSPGFRDVIGIPRGGIRLQDALKKYIDPQAPATLLVDDVLTTGNSMTNMAHRIWQDSGDYHLEIHGAVMFARGLCPDWIKAVIPLPEFFWVNHGTQNQGASHNPPKGFHR